MEQIRTALYKHLLEAEDLLLDLAEATGENQPEAFAADIGIIISILFPGELI